MINFSKFIKIELLLLLFNNYIFKYYFTTIELNMESNMESSIEFNIEFSMESKLESNKVILNEYKYIIYSIFMTFYLLVNPELVIIDI